MFKVISFDMDGTLITPEFSNAVWREGLPEEYSWQKGKSLTEARKIVNTELGKITPTDMEWYDIIGWIDKLELDIEAYELVKKYEGWVKIYDGMKETVKRCKETGTKVIVISNAAHVFMEIGLLKFGFDDEISTTEDYGGVKSAMVFSEICENLRVKPGEMLHIGDNYEMDFVEPMKAGLNAMHVKRG